MASRRNVLLIIADQRRGDSLGFLGHLGVRTPYLGALTQRIVTFTSHFGQSAPCAPARASMFARLYVINRRVIANGLPPDSHHPNLALELRRAGNDPSLVGYTTTAPDPRSTNAQDIRFCEWGDVQEGCRVAALLAEAQTRVLSWRMRHAVRTLTHLCATPAGLLDRRECGDAIMRGYRRGRPCSRSSSLPSCGSAPSSR